MYVYNIYDKTQGSHPDASTKQGDSPSSLQLASHRFCAHSGKRTCRELVGRQRYQCGSEIGEMAACHVALKKQRWSWT